METSVPVPLTSRGCLSHRWGPSPGHLFAVACVHVGWRVLGQRLSFPWMVLLLADVISLSGTELAFAPPPLSRFEFRSTPPELLPFWKQKMCECSSWGLEGPAECSTATFQKVLLSPVRWFYLLLWCGDNRVTLQCSYSILIVKVLWWYTDPCGLEISSD